MENIFAFGILVLILASVVRLFIYIHRSEKEMKEEAEKAEAIREITRQAILRDSEEADEHGEEHHPN